MLYLDDTPAANLAWMPAHTAERHVGVCRLSNGQLLTHADRQHNDEADRLAKQAAELDRVPLELRKVLLAHAGRVLDVAAWIGRATLAANNHEVWQVCDGGRAKVRMRDAEARPEARPRAQARRRSTPAAGSEAPAAGSAPPAVLALGRGRAGHAPRST
eukprot:11658964-Alexandrium_andersonii.AAC.1